MLRFPRLVPVLLSMAALAAAFSRQTLPKNRLIDTIQARHSQCMRMGPVPFECSELLHRPSLRRIWKRSKKSIASFAIALTMLRSPASAVVSKNLVDVSARANDVLIESLRPGATIEDAEAALNPDVIVREKEEVNSVVAKTDERKTDKRSKKKVSPKNLYYDDDEDDLDDDDPFFEHEERAQLESSSVKSKSATSSDLFLKTTKITTATYGKAVVMFLAAPVLLFGGIETYKRKSESAYVKKALKIQAMKREEYLNKTASEAARLASMKGNETGTDDQDDDDEEDDDNDDEEEEEEDNDDEDEKPSPKNPKKPGEGGGGEPPPSRDDIDRLNKLIGKK